ncbi:MAG: nucleotidyltransferase family protein [Hyphomicrobium sp.]|nr:nucleotidyltransferase family protein [Hyphomicrobium sp.]
MKIAGIIVAAGRSSRFEGGNKLLAEIDGKPLIRNVIDAACDAALDEIVVVTAPGAPAVHAAASRDAWRTIVNPDAAAGLSTSIRCGLSAIDQTSDGALIILADMPRLTARLINDLCAAFAARNAQAIVFPQSRDGRQGNPVLWPRMLYAELMALSGDAGGKVLLAANPGLLQPVAVEGDAAFVDIDTRADLARLMEGQD